MTGLKPARLRMILGENNTEKLTLPNGIPDSIDINAEFQRLVALPLEQTFLAQLDKYSDELIHIIQAKGGATCEKTANIMQTLDQVYISPMLTLTGYHNLNIM
ncbi:hypothetical protein L3Q82_014285 [Scortum barcoo]|uniref:Uncharacterized protein n=1 Tax=Scortum barcoo TaxID=214431 RepID=A0ACB8VWZ2_9TELE|nr:hypothetical protein L3Q82_014285 [Scortum barcoo]